MPLSMTVSPWASPSLWFCSIGVFVGLRLVLLVSFSLSNTYFYWDMKIPYLGWATSKPRKYFNLASAFISNSLIKHFLKASLPSKSSPITKMSLIGLWLPPEARVQNLSWDWYESAKLYPSRPCLILTYNWVKIKIHKNDELWDKSSKPRS